MKFEIQKGKTGIQGMNLETRGGIWNPGSEIRNTGSRIWNPGSEYALRQSRTEIGNPSSGIRDSADGIRKPNSFRITLHQHFTPQFRINRVSNKENKLCRYP